MFLLTLLVGGLSSVRADVIVTGRVQTEDMSVPTCSGAQVASSISVECMTTNPFSFAVVQGSGDPFQGALYAEAGVSMLADPFAFASAYGVLDLNETYYLMGGSGTTTVDFNLESFTEGQEDSAEITCSFSFNGLSEACTEGLGPGSETFAEQVQYGIPFSIDLDVSFDPRVYVGLDLNGQVDYSFSAPGLVAEPTPEPSSVLLLMPGIAGVVFATKSRIKPGSPR